MIAALTIAAGGLGALARHGVRQAVQVRLSTERPFGTAAANVIGSALLGALVGAGSDQEVLRVLGTGFLGGFTTFSTWMVEAWALTEGRRPHPVWFTWDVAGVLAAGWGAYVLASSLVG